MLHGINRIAWTTGSIALAFENGDGSRVLKGLGSGSKRIVVLTTVENHGGYFDTTRAAKSSRLSAEVSFPSEY